MGANTHHWDLVCKQDKLLPYHTRFGRGGKIDIKKIMEFIKFENSFLENRSIGAARDIAKKMSQIQST